MNCHSIQFQSASLLMSYLCSLPGSLRPWMHSLCCLSLLSLCCLSLLSLDLGLYHGFLLSLRPCVGLPSDLLRRGGLLLKSGGPLRRRGGLLLGSGGLLLCRGERLLRPGGLQFHLLRPDGLQSRLLCPGGLQSRLLRPGGLQSRLLRPGGLQFRRLRPGFLLCRLCLGPQPLHFHVDLALRPFPCSASATPPSWIVQERLEAAPWGGAMSRILSMHFRSLATRGHPLTTLTLALHKLLHITLDCISHHPLHWRHTQLIPLITLTPENYHTLSHTLYKPWTFSSWCRVLICV